MDVYTHMVINDDLDVCYDTFQTMLGPVYNTSIVRSHTSLIRPLRLSRMTTSMRSPAYFRNSALAYCLVPRIDTLSLVTCAQRPVPLPHPSVPPALTRAAPSPRSRRQRSGVAQGA